ncbi:MAG: DUF2023 family protein [Spirochaetes bacterium]|nr:DUF2023 family protein [Spirochaetota bacterium]
MKVFCHHIYEYRKGLRDLILHTMSAQHRDEVEGRLTRRGIDYLIHQVTEEKINVYFGNPLCVDMVKRMSSPRLSDLTDQEDFILAIMPGYGMLHQCQRYLERLRKSDAAATPVSLAG